MTTVAEAIARSISHTEIATIETAGVATIVEELRDAAAKAGLEVVVNDENDGAKDVVAFDPGTPEGESVWRVRVRFER